MKHSLTHDEALSIFNYDEVTGKVFWKKRIHKRIRVGQEAGRLTGHGYRKITAFGKEYYTHRLVWFLITGSFPKHQIDHIDGNRQNNVFSNLRECTQKENRQNISITNRNTSGFVGVRKTLSGKFSATIGKKYIGSFETPEDAYKAVVSAKQVQYPFYAGRN